ncbi:MAG: peptide ABC transporter substrate-binding protein [Candidatus Giovannonibacteria bacterium]|nr:MAG: peptide ABC transporter substrate-binding protein [Candidatus Giovannonibacteria bacterium]
MRAEILVLIVLALIALVSFLGILTEINKKFGVETPAFGGTLREGVVGSPRFMNPLLAQSDADRDLVSLLYSDLLRHDGEGKPKPALAEKYEVSPDGREYTVTLKDKLYWSDGEKLTADDVIFTISMAKNPLVQSIRRANWEGVEVEKIDERRVRFRLNKAYAPFLENLTLGILPKHVWEKIPASQISLAELNTNPVGAGPYKIKSVDKDSRGSIVSATLTANRYFALGKPHIKTVFLKFYPDEDSALKGLESGAIDAYGAISPKNIDKLGSRTKVEDISLERVIAVFLNQGAKKEFASADVRKALNAAVDKKALLDRGLWGRGKIIDGPLPEAAENNLYDPDAARSIVSKSKKEISFTLTTARTAELLEIAEILKNMWNEAGFKVEVKNFPVGDLEQSVIGPRRYDAFLYGEELVGKNPDPFAFWHSSQRNHPGYNIALYANSRVDKLLEDVRVEQSEEKRAELYKNIQREIKRDQPAVFLFSPSYLYAVPRVLGGIEIKSVNTGSDRYDTIHNWYLERMYVWKIFIK